MVLHGLFNAEAITHVPEVLEDYDAVLYVGPPCLNKPLRRNLLTVEAENLSGATLARIPWRCSRVMFKA